MLSNVSYIDFKDKSTIVEIKICFQIISINGEKNISTIVEIKICFQIIEQAKEIY